MTNVSIPYIILPPIISYKTTKLLVKNIDHQFFDKNLPKMQIYSGVSRPHYWSSTTFLVIF